MNFVRLVLPLVSVSLAIAGCSRTHIPSPADLPIVYKIDVQQGNVVTQDMLAQLKPGMDRGKVKFIMGTPLIADTFHNDRWDYIFTMQERGGERAQRRVSVYFHEDKLVRVAGDVKAASGAIAASDESAAKTIEVPAAEKDLVERMKDKVSGGADKKAAVAKESISPVDSAKTEAAAASDAAKTEAATTTDAAKSDDTAVTSDSAKTEATSAPEAAAKQTTAPAMESSANKAQSGGDFVIDNSSNNTGTPAESNAADDKAKPVPAPSAADSAVAEQPTVAPEPAANKDIMPRFRSESDLEADDTTAPAASTDTASTTAAEAASGSDEKSSTSAAGGTGKTTTVSVPDNAPQPKKKGFFRRLLEKVGVGDNEDGEYQSADPKYKDVSNPETQSH